MIKTASTLLAVAALAAVLPIPVAEAQQPSVVWGDNDTLRISWDCPDTLGGWGGDPGPLPVPGVIKGGGVAVAMAGAAPPMFEGGGGEPPTTIEICYSTTPPGADLDAAFAAGTTVSDEPAAAPGQVQTYDLNGLVINQIYYVFLKYSGPTQSSPVYSCSGSTTPDIGAPLPITDLTVWKIDQTSIGVQWTAPGDDPSGPDAGLPCQEQVIALSKTPILNQADFDAALQLGAGAPPACNEAVSIEIVDVDPDTEYYMSVRVRDDQSQWSLMSNVVTARTLIHTDGGSKGMLGCSSTPRPSSAALFLATGLLAALAARRAW